MSKHITVFLFLLVSAGSLYSQTDEASLIAEGQALYDKGDYKAALAKYREVLKTDKNSPDANYETALTYYAMEDYKKAIEYCDNVIDYDMRYVDQAYSIKGSSLDMMDKPQDAIEVYKKGIKKFPDDYLLYYNLGLTSYNTNDYEAAEDALTKALKSNPEHASSHFLLGYLMYDEHQRIKSMLAFYNFLMLEPTGQRAGKAIDELDKLMNQGVTQTDDKSTTIMISGLDSKDDFKSAELMLSLMVASKTMEENKDKSESELFCQNTKLLFSTLADMREKNKGFWWDFYVDFFDSLNDNENMEAFCHLIRLESDGIEAQNWLDTNKDKSDKLVKWYQGYERKN